MKTSLQHKHGGTITEITLVGHETNRQIAEWFFVGNVTWEDGSMPEGAHIRPNMLCADSGEERADLQRVMEALARYLMDRGAWLDKIRWVHGNAVNWIPATLSGREPIETYLDK